MRIFFICQEISYKEPITNDSSILIFLKEIRESHGLIRSFMLKKNDLGNQKHQNKNPCTKHQKTSFALTWVGLPRFAV